jgi:hypothetical protein
MYPSHPNATLIFLWWLPSTKISHTSLLFVASLIRSSMTIKLGYLVSINESSFRFSGKHDHIIQV